jgi:hypothetical protein
MHHLHHCCWGGGQLRHMLAAFTVTVPCSAAVRVHAANTQCCTQVLTTPQAHATHRTKRMTVVAWLGTTTNASPRQTQCKEYQSCDCFGGKGQRNMAASCGGNTPKQRKTPDVQGTHCDSGVQLSSPQLPPPGYCVC